MQAQFLIFTVLLLAWWSRRSTPSSEENNDPGEKEDRIRSRDHIDHILLGEMSEDDSSEKDTKRKQDELRQREQALLQQLRDIYHSKIRPIEKQFHYSDLKKRHVLTDADIYAKPIALLVGPWSTGKSTIINYILGTERNIQGLHVGAEPTTADFTVITYGEEYRTVEGIVLATDTAKPFTSMEKFGQVFLEHLLGIEMPKPTLRNITFIDTPGILENRRQQERGYPYNDVLRWLVQRADLIFVVFDPTKLDVGTELESLFLQLKGKESALRIILNKADSMNEQELMRVYGALFWSLAPLINVTEPPRIYVGSFWSRRFQSKEAEQLLLEEEKSLLKDMREVIRNQVQNKIAFIRQQAIRVRIHALLTDSYVTAYRKNKGFFNGGDELAIEITNNANHFNVYKTILSHPNVSEYDLPDPDEYKEFFRINPMYEMKKVKDFCGWGGECPFDKLEYATSYELPQLLQQYQKETQEKLKETECDEKLETCMSHDGKKEEWMKVQWNKAKMYSRQRKQKSETEETKMSAKLSQDTTGVPKVKETQKYRVKKKNYKILAEAKQTDQDTDTAGTTDIETRDKEYTERKEYTTAEPDSSEEKEERYAEKELSTKSSATYKQKENSNEKSISEQKKSPLDSGYKQIHCKWRKSCYATGIVSKMAVSDIMPILPDRKEESIRKSMSIQEACKWRKSCYKTGKQQQTQKNLKHDGEHGKKTAQTEDKATEKKPALEVVTAKPLSNYEKKLKCLFRKSCYETGIVPNITRSVSVIGQKQPQATPQVEEKSEYSTKLQCKFRKSCINPLEPVTVQKKHYKNVNKEVVKPDKMENKYFKAGDSQGAKITDPMVRKASCKWRKSCYATGIVPEIHKKLDEKIRPEKESASSTEPLAKRCKWRKNCYEKEWDTKDIVLTKSKRQETEPTQEGEETKQFETEKETQLPEYKDSIFTSRVLEVEEPTENTTLTTKKSKTERQDTTEKSDVHVGTTSKTQKIWCHWRKSCYRSGVLPDLLSKSIPSRQKEANHNDHAFDTKEPFVLRHELNQVVSDCEKTKALNLSIEFFSPALFALRSGASGR